MRAGIVKENEEKQRNNERLERNRLDHEIQQKLSAELNKANK